MRRKSIVLAAEPPVLLASVVIILLAGSRTSAVQPAQLSSEEKSEKIKRIDEMLSRYHDLGQFQGAALVAMHGEVIYRKGFGQANVEWGICNSPETKFRIASHGKGFTAVLILQLREQGRLDLHTYISEYIPAYRKDNARKVTVHHLLSHTSGIPGVPQEWVDTSYRNPYTMKELVELANQGELEFEPGSQFRYCNNGYNLLGAIIENLTGKKYEQGLKERILDPLGMNDTGLYKHQPILEKRAAGYNRMFWGEMVNAPYMDESFAVGAGGHVFDRGRHVQVGSGALRRHAAVEREQGDHVHRRTLQQRIWLRDRPLRQIRIDNLKRLGGDLTRSTELTMSGFARPLKVH